MPASPSPVRVAALFEGGAALTTYRVTLRDRETQTIVGYYNGSWTTDGRRALTLRQRNAAEANAAHMCDRCPRDADLVKVEESAAEAAFTPYGAPHVADNPGANHRPRASYSI